MVSLRDAHTDSPSPSPAWREMSDTERLTLVTSKSRAGASAFGGIVVITAAKQDGQIIVGLTKPLPSHERGSLLLDLEEFLKKTIDSGLVVWLEPLGDRNSLRNLRGIEVKA